MPIYEYHCDQCGREFERLVFGQEVPVCAACGADTVHRIPSSCGYVSKSGGQTVSRSAGSSCGACSGGNCSGCGH